MKFGVIGYGSIGSRHAKNLEKLGHKVVVYDPALLNRDVNRETAIYDDKSIDGVIIATPSPYHEGPLRACVERGKHIFVEKPISTSIGMLPQLLKAADEKGLVVMVGTNLHFHPTVERTKTMIDVGIIGRPLWANFICAQLNTKYRDSVILNWGAHDVDLAMHFFWPIDAVVCVGVRELRAGNGSSDVNAIGLGLDDIADFTLLHKSGMRSSFHLDYITPNQIREAWIVGEDKNIGLDLISRRLTIGSLVHADPGSFDTDYEVEMQAFVRRIEQQVGGARLVRHIPTGWRGLEVLKVLLDVRKKAGLL